jgi:phage terminase large subunit-like protein
MEMLERGFKFRLQPLLVMITNSGSDRKSVCWEEHIHAIAVAAGEKEDDQLFAYVCALDEGDNPLEDPSCWAKANPMLGVIITEEYLRGVVNQARDLPSKQNNILRLHFCVWTDATDAWITRAAWERCEDATLRLGDMRGRKCWAGIDLSQTRDMTATALVFEDGWKDVPHPEDPTQTVRKGKYCLFVKAYTPKDTLAKRAHEDKAPYEVWVRDGHLQAVPGPVIRLDIVAYDLIEISRTYDLQLAAYDDHLFREFRQELEEMNAPDLPLQDHPQGVSRRNDNDMWMPGSVDAFENMILEGRIRIAINPVLRGAVASTVFWKSPAGLRRFDKAKAVARIDAAVASAMAIGAAAAREEDRISVYDVIEPGAISEISAYDDIAGEIDYSILNNLNHPRQKEMLARYELLQELEDQDA